MIVDALLQALVLLFFLQRNRTQQWVRGAPQAAWAGGCAAAVTDRVVQRAGGEHRERAAIYGISALQLLLLDLSDHPGRIARHDRVRRNAPGDDCPCAHHGVPAYRHARQEDRTTA